MPNTFRLCDGTRGTPDLRDRFVVGAGSAYAPAAVGGSFVHTHPFTGSSHMHDIPTDTAIAGGPNYDDDLFAALSTGTTNQASGILPYYALCFVMYDGRPI